MAEVANNAVAALQQLVDAAQEMMTLEAIYLRTAKRPCCWPTTLAQIGNGKLCDHLLLQRRRWQTSFKGDAATMQSK